MSFTSDEARTAMRVTERLASLFIEENLRDREVLAEGTNQFLEAQLEDARRRLIETEKKARGVPRQHSGELPTQLEANMQGLHNIEMQLQALTEALNRDRDRRLVVERSDRGCRTPPDAPPPPRRRPSRSRPAPMACRPARRLPSSWRRRRPRFRAMQTRMKPQHPGYRADEAGRCGAPEEGRCRGARATGLGPGRSGDDGGRDHARETASPR